MLFFLVNRGFRASAYQPDVGLFLAGGGGGAGWTNTLEMSTDNAQTFQYLSDIDYSQWIRGILGSCLVIADSNTLVVIGGRSRSASSKLKARNLKS